MATKDQTTAAAAESTEAKQPHGGLLIARRLKAHGVSKLFTLSGGHLFSIYDGCRDEGVDIVDVRHESSAAFAAEGWAKVTREPGVAALTAGPGVTNGMSALASAHKNNSPMLVLGGRAPQFRWGQGSLQEIDHVPFVAPLTKSARTATSTAEVPQLVDEALAATLAVPTGPAFLDLPLDVVFMEADDPGGPATLPDPGVAARRRRARDRAHRRTARRGRAPGDHGRHRPLLGSRRGRAARALRSARHPRVPERPRARVSAGGSSELLLARTQRRAEGRRRRARDGRADGLPPWFRRELRRGHAAGADRLRRIPAAWRHASWPASCTAASRRRSPRCARQHSTPAAPRSGPPRGAKALRETEDEKRAAEREQLDDDRAPAASRCASTRSWTTSSTATRS